MGAACQGLRVRSQLRSAILATYLIAPRNPGQRPPLSKPALHDWDQIRPRRRFCEPCKPSVLDDWPGSLFDSLLLSPLRSKERNRRSLRIANGQAVSAGRRSYAADKSTPYAWPPTAADHAVIFASEHRSKFGMTSPPCRSAVMGDTRAGDVIVVRGDSSILNEGKHAEGRHKRGSLASWGVNDAESLRTVSAPPEPPQRANDSEVLRPRGTFLKC